LNTRNRLLVRFRPEKSGKPSQVAVERTKEPPLGGDKPFNAPDVKSAKLENGMEVFVVERAELPKVAVSFRNTRRKRRRYGRKKRACQYDRQTYAARNEKRGTR
jgi:hypothetical protein